MRRHKDNGALQERGCGALRNLAGNSENEVKVAAEGGIAVVIDAMRRHKDNGALQERGCGALLNIGWSSLECRILIKSAGGTEAVTRAMNAAGATAECRSCGQQLIDRLK
jgi:hypothetical protein